MYTGIRAGEKLSDELYSVAEARDLRTVDKILICRPKANESELFDERLEALRVAAEACQREKVMRLLQEIVPEYQAESATGRTAAGAYHGIEPE